MADVRTLNLDTGNIESFSAIDRSEYFIDSDKRNELISHLSAMVREGLWTPHFQAWRPFVKTYLRSGIDPDINSKWASAISDREKPMQPTPNHYSDMISELREMYYRSNRNEVFPNASWNDICLLYNQLDTLVTNEKMVKNYIYSPVVLNEALITLLDKEDGERYSKNLAYAIHLYTHCFIGPGVVSKVVTDSIEEQLDYWLEDYSAEFKRVAEFAGNTSSVYRWYTDEVLDIMCNAWRKSLRVRFGETVLEAGSLLHFPLWLSENIHKEINWIPGIQSSDMNDVYIFDSIYAAINIDKVKDDFSFIYALCVSESGFKRCMKHFDNVCCDLRTGKFITNMKNIQILGHSYGDPPHPLTPEGYVKNLKVRGFPV